jgi:hypothetical protein
MQRNVYIVLVGKRPVQIPRHRWGDSIKMVLNKTQDGVGSSVVLKALCYKPEGRGFDTR